MRLRSRIVSRLATSSSPPPFIPLPVPRPGPTAGKNNMKRQRYCNPRFISLGKHVLQPRSSKPKGFPAPASPTARRWEELSRVVGAVRMDLRGQIRTTRPVGEVKVNGG